MKTNWGAVVGAFIFIGGIFAGSFAATLFSISLLGLIIALVSTLLRGRSVRKNWIKVLAHCIDKEWTQVLGASGQRGGVRMTWTFQLRCEFEFNGQRYTVAPEYWSTFISENRLKKFLNSVITPDKTCHLWINPENPLQAELYAHDIKDFLLH